MSETLNAWEFTELERKGITNLTEEELEAYITYKAEQQAAELHAAAMAEEAEKLQAASEEAARAYATSAQQEFERHVLEILAKVGATDTTDTTEEGEV